MAEDDPGPDTLTGKWQGRYFYPRRPEPVAFEANLFDADGALGGSITERSALPDMGGAALYATLRGTRAGTAVRFLKTYEIDDPRYGRVLYSGTLSADRLHISGHWRIAGLLGLLRGRFDMTRPGKLKEAARAATRLVEPAG